MTADPNLDEAVTLARDLPHPPERVWRALTQPALMAEWLMAGDIRPDAGHRFQLVADWGRIDCEVLEVEPGRRLAYRWDSGALRSVVTWTLEARDGGTRLTMTQTGFAPGQTRFLEGARMGWPRFLDALARLLEERA